MFKRSTHDAYMPEAIDTDTIAVNAASPASASQDGRSATAHSIPDQILAKDEKKKEDSLAATNPQGGARSAWSLTRPARVVPPGTT